MVTQTVSIKDVKPLKNEPLPKVVLKLAGEVQARLPKCRAEWWKFHKTVCLDNKPVRKVDATSVAVLLEKSGKKDIPDGFTVEKSGKYDVSNDKVEARVLWIDGSRTTQVVGG